MKLIIVDFDHTISNTRKFQELLMDKFSITNKTEFHDKLHGLHVLHETDEVRSVLPEIRFEGVTDFLENMDNYFDVKILLTKSNYYIDWQEKNIEHAGLDQYFDELIITTDKKKYVIRDLFEKYPEMEITLLNDIYSHEPENEIIKQEFPQVNVISIDHYSEEGVTVQDFHNSLKK